MNVKDLLAKKNYLIRVTGEDDSCVVSFPSRVMGNKLEGYDVQYTIKKDGVHVSSPEHDMLIPMPDYSRRVFVIMDIIKVCNFIDYDSSLICYQNLEGEELADLKSILTFPMEQEELRKENLLSNEIVNRHNTYDLEGVDEEVLEGFTIIKGLFGE